MKGNILWLVGADCTIGDFTELCSCAISEVFLLRVRWADGFLR
jgi:hypothetical protein